MTRPPTAWLVAGGIAGGLVLLYIAQKGVKEAAGLVTGDNAITRAQTNAAGEPTTAYVGAGVAGTAGAVVNSATGGQAATFGEWLGGKLADWFDPATRAANESFAEPEPIHPTTWGYATGGATGSW
jgi:hypothetical protein